MRLPTILLCAAVLARANPATASPTSADTACDAAARRMLATVEAIAAERGDPLAPQAERAAALAALADRLAAQPGTCAMLLALPDGAFRALAEGSLSDRR